MIYTILNTAFFSFVFMVRFIWSGVNISYIIWASLSAVTSQLVAIGGPGMG